jgi:hypothetical protein
MPVRESAAEMTETVEMSPSPAVKSYAYPAEIPLPIQRKRKSLRKIDVYQNHKERNSPVQSISS